MSRYRYAARLNSFAALRERFWPGRTTPLSTLDLIDRAATVPGLTAVDVNFPQQTEGIPVAELRARIEGHGLHLNGYAMRYGGDPAFRSGAFTNADPAIRRRAIDLTKRAVDETRAAGGRMLTIWPGQDGFDHPFQVDYAQLWDWEVEGIRAVAEHDPSFPVSIEYKPNEPRSVFILPNVHATLLAIAEAGAKNLGVTLDVAHVFEADTNPALAAALVGRRSKLLGLHINDAYGRRDDGLMVGAVHTVQTIELLRRMRLDGFDGTIYLDTFPDTAALDPVDEARTGIAVIEAMLDLLDRLPEAELQAALTRHDAIAAHRIVQSAILGRAI